MNAVVTLSPESVEAVARRVLELQRTIPSDPDPRMTREQAAAYLNLSLRSFDRKRVENPASLSPADLHPLRWSKNALDVFKMGAALPERRGAKRRVAA